MNKTTFFSIISLISGLMLTFYFVSYVIPENNERLEETNQELIDSALDLLDVCVNAKSLGDIVNCDKDIPGDISKTCKDRNVKECDAKITEYYDTRDSRIERAHTALNSAFSNLIQACTDTYDQSCAQSLTEIKNFCEQYRNTVAYVDECNDPRL